MRTAQDACPPPQGCIDEFLDLVEQVAPNSADPNVQRLKAWLHGIREDNDGLAVLERARRARADLRRLLILAAFYLGWRAWLEGPLGRIEVGPIHLSPERSRDIDEAIAQATELEAAMARPSDLGAELRYMKDLLRPLDEEVRQHQGQVRTFYVRDGCGGLRQEKVILKSAAVAVAQATVSPGSAALTRPRGDAALDVLLLVVMGHLRYVTGDHQLVRAAELVAQGLKIGVSGEMGGPAYAVEAMRQRAYRCRDQSSKTDHRERAGIVARTIALSIRLD